MDSDDQSEKAEKGTKSRTLLNIDTYTFHLPKFIYQLVSSNFQVFSAKLVNNSNQRIEIY